MDWAPILFALIVGVAFLLVILRPWEQDDESTCPEDDCLLCIRGYEMDSDTCDLDGTPEEHEFYDPIIDNLRKMLDENPDRRR